MISFPWDSIVEYMDDGYPVYDRAYSAQQWRDIYQTFFSNGIFLDTNQSFVVTPGDAMNVIVAPGRCSIVGTFGIEESPRELELMGASTKDRIDTIVLRWDANVETRAIDLYVKTGVAGDAPKRPELTRDETVWELGLCDIYIPKGTVKPQKDRITDTRLETARCGVVTPFATIDTTTFYNQIQAALDKMREELDRQTQKAVDIAQSALDGTIIGQLQTEIDKAVKEKVDIAAEEITSDPNDNTVYYIKENKAVKGSRIWTWLKAKVKSAFGFNDDDKLPVGRITGTLPLANGGTAMTKNPSMLTNLGSTSADTVFKESPRPGIQGTLAVDHGGTGATSAANARSNLGINSLFVKRTITQAYNLPANAAATLTLTIPTVSGYKPIGFYQVSVGSTYAALNGFYIKSDTSAEIVIRGLTGNAYNPTCYVQVSYIKDI